MFRLLELREDISSMNEEGEGDDSKSHGSIFLLSNHPEAHAGQHGVYGLHVSVV